MRTPNYCSYVLVLYFMRIDWLSYHHQLLLHRLWKN